MKEDRASIESMNKKNKAHFETFPFRFSRTLGPGNAFAFNVSYTVV